MSKNKKKHDDVIMIIDRSGSMGSIRQDAEGGVNSFIDEQKEVDKKTKLTLAEFDHDYNLLYDRANIDEVAQYKLVPRGTTALLDAIGRTLTQFKDKKIKGKKVVVIVTDGGENASRDFSRDDIFEMITKLKEKDWQFMFLAANQDAIAAGGSIGIDPNATINFAATGDGAKDAYYAASVYASSLRTKSVADAVADLDDVKNKSSNIS